MNSVLITGGSGGLGKSLKKSFFDKGYYVINLDRVIDESHCHLMLNVDIEELVNSEDVLNTVVSKIEKVDQANKLTGIVHNAAIQILGGVDELTVADLQRSINVNVISAFAIISRLRACLSRNHGSIINVGSIHASQTKKNFLAYSVSKAALRGLTKALALECGASILVNSVEPAAIATDMLVAGFKGKTELLNKLSECHPTGNIGVADDVAEFISRLISHPTPFMNGASIELDGGISKRLFDPG